MNRDKGDMRERIVQISGGRVCQEGAAGAKALVEDVPCSLEGICGGQLGWCGAKKEENDGRQGICRQAGHVIVLASTSVTTDVMVVWEDTWWLPLETEGL